MANHRKAADGGNVYFSRRQLFVVAALFLIASALIFLLGVLIGQSIEERKLLRREEPAVRVPLKSGAPADEQEMTFYETLTKPEAPPPSAQETGADGADRWTLQVVASRSRTSAESLASALKKRGYEAYVATGEHNRETIYRVRVGTYGTRQGAMADLQRLKAANYKNAMITRNR